MAVELLVAAPPFSTLTRRFLDLILLLVSDVLFCAVLFPCFRVSLFFPFCFVSCGRVPVYFILCLVATVCLFVVFPVAV